MDTPKHYDALVAPLRDDVASGASVVADRASGILRQAAKGVHAETVPELRAALSYVALRILDAQPAMAPLVRLAAQVVDAVGGSNDVPAARAAAAAAAAAFARHVTERAEALAERTAGALPPRAEVLTLSSSSAVLRALLHPSARGIRRVVVLESRPVREGRDTARVLARAGVTVDFAVDAAVGTLVRSCSVVLLGADSVGDLGVVNKIGSLAAALSAREAGVPVVVSADTTKILPSGFPQHLGDDRPGAQVWQSPGGVRVWNRYFEAVPLAAVTHLVTEDDVLDPTGLDSVRRGLGVPDELRRWAERRAGEAPESHGR